MSIGTFFIVYRVYYQQRRVFRSRRTGANNPMGVAPNKAKSLFYLLFTLNLLYFILVSPVVFVTTILFRNPNEEVAYPRFKAIIYLMQYCNHSLNFIFYGKLILNFSSNKKKSFVCRNNITTISTNIIRMVSRIISTFTSMLSTNNSKTIKIISFAE
jgi:hypothetical protein